MNKTNRFSGFTMVELIAVVSLLAILGTGAMIGLKQSRQNAEFQKVVRDLNAIDLAKKNWGMFHSPSAWPTGTGSNIEGDRRAIIISIVGTSALDAPSDYIYYVGDLGEPAAATYGTYGTTVNRPH